MDKKDTFLKLSWSISVLNLLDLIFTVIGVEKGIIKEANPLLIVLWDKSLYYVIGLKLFFSVIFFLAPCYLPKEFERKKIWTKVLIVLCIIYFLIFLYHLLWVGLYFYTVVI